MSAMAAYSGSTLVEASSWGKVDTVFEQMVFAEATLAVPLIADMHGTRERGGDVHFDVSTGFGGVSPDIAQNHRTHHRDRTTGR